MIGANSYQSIASVRLPNIYVFIYLETQMQSTFVYCPCSCITCRVKIAHIYLVRTSFSLSFALNVHFTCLKKFDAQSVLALCFFRSVGRTQMNEQSSRSHFVFTLRISGVNEVYLLTMLYSCLCSALSTSCMFLSVDMLSCYARALNNKYRGF